MRHIIELKDGWQFTNLDGQTSEVSIPHTWNAIDGQDRKSTRLNSSHIL